MKIKRDTQHVKACKSCPFSRTCTPGELGGSPITTYLGQIAGPFFLPCHSIENYKGNNETIHDCKVGGQCAGTAVFRANIGVDSMMPDALLHLPALSDPNVFATLPEFIKHHVPDATDAKVAAMVAMVPEFVCDQLRIAAAKGRTYKI